MTQSKERLLTLRQRFIQQLQLQAGEVKRARAEKAARTKALGANAGAAAESDEYECPAQYHILQLPGTGPDG